MTTTCRRRNLIIAVTGSALVVTALTVACEGNGGQNPQASATSSAASSSSGTPGQHDQLALQILDAIVREDFNAATAQFDSLMKKTVPPDKLASSWATYQQTFGKYQSHGSPQDNAVNIFTVVNVPLQMEKMPGEFRVTFSPNREVSGLYFLKTGVPLPTL